MPESKRSAVRIGVHLFRRESLSVRVNDFVAELKLNSAFIAVKAFARSLSFSFRPGSMPAPRVRRLLRIFQAVAQPQLFLARA
jgi:hypothetical protein